jgi:hypothetical protein
VQKEAQPRATIKKREAPPDVRMAGKPDRALPDKSYARADAD